MVRHQAVMVPKIYLMHYRGQICIENGLSWSSPIIKMKTTVVYQSRKPLQHHFRLQMKKIQKIMKLVMP